jgi:hypothetical protein
MGTVVKSIGIVSLFEVDRVVAQTFCMEEGVVPLVSVEVCVCEVGKLFAKDAMIHVSVK